MQPFDEESSEQLEYYPASLFVIERVKIKYACFKKCAEKPDIPDIPGHHTYSNDSNWQIDKWNR
jgi:hypothetical protein